MSKKALILIAVIFSSTLLINSSKVNAQLFGTDEMNWAKIFKKVNKINERLTAIETSDEWRTVGSRLEHILKQTEEIKHALPQDSMGDVIDQINLQNIRLEDTNLIFRSELIPAINKDIKANKLTIYELQVKVNMGNEKLSRLIEILKAVVKEQAKLDPVAKALSDIQTKQKALQKAQAGFIKDQAAVKEALADLRRKANVNISRSDDIKKTVRKLGLAISNN